MSNHSNNKGTQSTTSSPSPAPSPTAPSTLTSNTPSSSSSFGGSFGVSTLPNARAQYKAAMRATTASTAQNRPPPMRATPSQPPRERFADLRWMWSRQLKSPNNLTREEMERLVLSSTRVQQAIERISSDPSSAGGNTVSREDAQKTAKSVFASMYADINEANVRTAIYMMRKVWRTMYEGIRVNEDGIHMLHEYSRAKILVVLLPMHKSHIDYLLLSYVCMAYNLYPPHIVAGDNLNMPLVGPILRHGGGLFIRRSFGSDELYKNVFYEYIATLLQHGHWMEVFIEGTRSRMGKLKTPKIGFLSVLVDLLVNGRLGSKDIMLVPIAISYDKVIEGSTYVNEMLGAKKQKESLTQTINSVNHVIRLNFGSIDVSISQGISLRDALGMGQTSVPSSIPFLQHTQHEQKRIITSIAHKIMFEMNLKLVISPTSIVATVLLTNLNRGISRKDIIRKTELIKDMIIERDGQVAHIFNVESMAAIVDRALKVLNKLLQEQHNIIFGFRNITSLELSFYRNQLLHVFVSESMTCIAMAAEYKDVKQIRNSTHQTGTTMVQKSKLIESVRFISQLLKFEFIYKPAPDLEDNVELTLDALCQRGILKSCVMPNGDGPSYMPTVPIDSIHSHAAAGGSNSMIRAVSLNPTGVDTFLFLSMLSWPFIETYWVAIASLFILLPDVIMDVKKLSEIASRRAEALFYSGHIEFYEALNTESILNAYEWCVSQGILRVHQVGNTRMMQLTKEYQQAPDDHPNTSIPLPQYSTHTQESSTTQSYASSSPPSSSSSSASSSAPSLTKKHTSLDSLRSPRLPSSPSTSRQSLRDLVLRVGRFRKIRLVATDSSKSLFESFVDDLCDTADQSNLTPSINNLKPAMATVNAATNAAAAAQKLLKARL